MGEWPCPFCELLGKYEKMLLVWNLKIGCLQQKFRFQRGLIGNDDVHDQIETSHFTLWNMDGI
jgi:hypothetical protein